MEGTGRQGRRVIAFALALIANAISCLAAVEVTFGAANDARCESTEFDISAALQEFLISEHSHAGPAEDFFEGHKRRQADLASRINQKLAARYGVEWHRAKPEAISRIEEQGASCQGETDPLWGRHYNCVIQPICRQTDLFGSRYAARYHLFFNVNEKGVARPIMWTTNPPYPPTSEKGGGSWIIMDFNRT